jgi:hypothetical protein
MRSLPFLLLFACRSVAGDVTLTSLTDEEALALCEEFHQNERRLNCGGPVILLPESDDQACADRIVDIPTGCPATATEFRECRRAIRADDACEPTTDLLPECEWQNRESCYRPF